MTLAGSFNSLFHYVEAPLSLSIFRICFGLLLTLESIGLVKWGGELFGFKGLAPAQKIGQTNLFSLGRNSDSRIRWLFLIYSLSCVCLAAGLLTRLAAFSVFLNFASRSKQNWYVVQGGDNLAKFMSFLMIFSNAGASLSLDVFFGLHWMYTTSLPSSQWPQRLMQIQVSIVYIRTVLWKLKVHNWIDGSAVFHAVYRNPHYRWKSLPGWFSHGPLIALMTWSTLAAELAAGTLIWFRETRYPTMAAIVTVHLTIESFIKIKYFQIMMIVCLLLFVPSDDWLALSSHLVLRFL